MKTALEIACGLLLTSGILVAKYGMPQGLPSFSSAQDQSSSYNSPDNPWAIGAERNDSIRRAVGSNRHVYFRYCSEARAAGAAPIYRGQPGYASHLDRDGDGIACEPYRGR